MASSESSGAPPSTLQTSSSADAAGCGAYAPSTLCTNPECDSTSQFVTQLYGLPTAHYIFHLYGQIKASNRLFTVSLNMLESVAAVIVKPIHSRIGEQVALADKQAARCVEAISQKYPFVHGNPAHIVETVKTRSVRTVQKGARVIVRSYPGQLLFKGVDLSLRATLGAGAYLNKVANPPESESAPPLSSENTATTETDPTDTTTCPVLSLTHSLRKTWQSITLPGPVRKSINIPVALLKRLTSLLKRFRHILRRIEGRKRRSHRHGSDARSPDRLNQIETRRKITPKKRSSTGVFQRVKFTAQRLLGLKQTTNPTLDKAVMTCGLDKGSDADKKRKHDDILTDDSDESMYTFDLDNYKSEDDPDFESPSDYSSTDSLEYGDGDTESDIEFEETYVGQTLMVKQIKETSTRKDEKACREVITPKTTQDTKGQLDTKAVEAGTKGQLDTKPVYPGMKGQLDTKAVELGTKGQLDTKTVEPVTKGQLDSKTVEPVTKGQLDSKTVEPVTKGQLDSKKMELDTKGQLDSSKERIGEKSGQMDVKGVKSVHVDVKTAKTGHVDVKKLTDTEKNSPVDANKGKDTEKPLDIKKGKDSEKMDRKPVVNGHHEKSGLQSVAKGSVDAKGKPQTQPAPIKDAKSSKQGVHDGSSDKPSAKTADGQPTPEKIDISQASDKQCKVVYKKGKKKHPSSPPTSKAAQISKNQKTLPPPQCESLSTNQSKTGTQSTSIVNQPSTCKPGADYVVIESDQSDGAKMTLPISDVGAHVGMSEIPINDARGKEQKGTKCELTQYVSIDENFPSNKMTTDINSNLAVGAKGVSQPESKPYGPVPSYSSLPAHPSTDSTSAAIASSLIGL